MLLLLESRLDPRVAKSVGGRMKNSYKVWGAIALTFAALAGCGGGSSDSTAPDSTPAGPPVAVPTGTSPITLTANTPPATFAALAPKVTVGRIEIASPPVVHFALTDVDGLRPLFEF